MVRKMEAVTVVVITPQNTTGRSGSQRNWQNQTADVMDSDDVAKGAVLLHAAESCVCRVLQGIQDQSMVDKLYA